MLRLVLLCVFALCVPSPEVRAASLFGKVIDVSSGDVITVFNMNRPVRVRLLGVDAPEMDQAFGDVAKTHLADLVHEKIVLVEYSGIAADHSVAGRVLLNDIDIGAQMIRDGVAWLDPNHAGRLSATDREIYAQSEQAARSERRGLWQAENPVAPWEFVKAESLKKRGVVRVNSGLAALRRGDQPKPELTNLTLMTAGMDASSARRLSRSEIENMWYSLTGTTKSWHEMQPSGQSFSVLVPGEGRQVSYPAAFGDEVSDLNMYIAREGSSLFAVLWFTGRTYGESHKLAMEAVLDGYVKGSHKQYAIGDRGHFLCGTERTTNISTNEYTGVEFDMSSCSLPTRARAFTRVLEDKRQMYLGVVFYGDEDENVARFLKSFTVAGRKGKPDKR